MKALILAPALMATTLMPATVQAETMFETARYTCERGVEVPVTYVNADDMSLAVLNVEGGQITLEVEQSASGARYGWPSDGSHYVWWTKGAEAALYWHDGETDEDAVLYADCVRN